MNSRNVILLCTAACLMAGCVPHSPIDARKTNSIRYENNSMSKSNPVFLADKDIFGNETTLSVSEEDIQAALAGENFRVPLNSAIILVQSGNRAPETAIQQEMSKYYIVSTFSGIPDRQKTLLCSTKDENGETVTRENMNYMQALRYVAAKGHQKAIIVYQDTLQIGQYDTIAKATTWADHKNGQLPDAASLRYLVRFTLVDVATGEWATWSPINDEYTILPTQIGKVDDDITEQQITQLKQKTYAAMVKDLVNRYQ